MTVLLTDEQKQLAETIRQFAAKELAPKAAHFDETESWNEPAFRAMGSMGLLGITAPEAYGGSAQGAVEATIAMEELGYACASSALSYLAHTILCVHNLATNASALQRQQYLPKLISGECIGAMAMTEPEAGSDALGMRTKAVREGDHYYLTGAKLYITNGPVADVIVTYARTGPNKKDISTFIVEKTFPGYKVSKKLQKMGMRASPTAELSFDRCKVPVANRIGDENTSVGHMMRNLNIERITISGISTGIARACLDYATRYVAERKQFNQPIGNFQMVQERLAEMATNLAAGRALLFNSATAYDRGENGMALGSMCKLFTANMATTAGLDTIQLLGGYGYMREYPVERYMRDAKLMEIGAGTNEVMRLLVARALLDGVKG